MKKIKYIRVSTLAQNTGRQEFNSIDFDKTFTDKTSGSIKFSERKEAKNLMLEVSNGKVGEVHVASIDRLGRTILDILTVIEYLHQHSVTLFVENIGMYSLINKKSNPSFKLIISVLGNVAEMERLNMLENQKNGILLAKKMGKYTGRLHGTKMTSSQILDKYKKVATELKAGQSLRRAALLGKCSLGTAQKIQRILHEESSS